MSLEKKSFHPDQCMSLMRPFGWIVLIVSTHANTEAVFIMVSKDSLDIIYYMQTQMASEL